MKVNGSEQRRDSAITDTGIDVVLANVRAGTNSLVLVVPDRAGNESRLVVSFVVRAGWEVRVTDPGIPILGAALVVEMLAHSGKTVSALLDQVHNITGRLYIVEESIPATPQMRVIIPQRLRDGVTAQIGTHTVESVSNLDGTKVRLGQDHSVLIRFSGTEPVLRIQAEASSREECHELIGHIKAIAGIAPA